jgi:hypothetical protein
MDYCRSVLAPAACTGRIVRRAMKPRHAAALALVVSWFLLLPPKDDRSVPLNDWFLFAGPFDSQSQCKSALIQDRQTIREPGAEKKMFQLGIGTEENIEHLKRIFDYYAECVADDDPRLKDK